MTTQDELDAHRDFVDRLREHRSDGRIVSTIATVDAYLTQHYGREPWS